MPPNSDSLPCQVIIPNNLTAARLKIIGHNSLMNLKTTDQWKVICAGIIGLSLVMKVSVAAAPTWLGIKVGVKADQPVTTAQSLQEQKDGFQRLAITLSNKGQQPLKIEKITVHIPVAEKLTDDLEMVYGGSCMGRTPLLRQNVGSPTAKSSSHMYEMVRLVDGKYLFAGSLSWRIFLPNFTLKQGALESWSDGEGRQLKPGETLQYEEERRAHEGEAVTAASGRQPRPP